MWIGFFCCWLDMTYFHLDEGNVVEEGSVTVWLVDDDFADLSGDWPWVWVLSVIVAEVDGVVWSGWAIDDAVGGCDDPVDVDDGTSAGEWSEDLEGDLPAPVALGSLGSADNLGDWVGTTTTVSAHVDGLGVCAHAQ